MEEQNTTPQAQPQAPVPGAVGALIFGIISLVLCWYFWIPWVGLVLTIATLVFGILAMSKGGKAVKEFNANPGQYKQGSLSLAKIGKILGIIGLILSIIFVILAILWSFIWGAAVTHMNY